MNTMVMPVSEEDLSRQWGVSMATLSRLRRTGQLGFTHVGKRVFYTEKHIKDYLNSGDSTLQRKPKTGTR